MTQRKGLPAKLALTDADDTRYDFRNLVVCNADGTPRGGITAPTTPLVTATATMNVSVAAYSAVAVRDAGAILLSNDGPTNVLLPNAPVSNSRIDVIYAKQNDASSTVTTPDANNNAILGVVVGTASATPSAPAIPVGAVKIVEVLIPSTATATNSSGVVITQADIYTAAPGATVPFRALANLKLWTTARDGQRAYAMDTGNEWEYIATAQTPGWFHVVGKPTVDAFSFGALYLAYGLSPARILTRNGKVELAGAFTQTAGTWAAGTAYTIGTIPAALAPQYPEKFTATWGDTGLVSINVNTDGTVYVVFTTAPGSVAAGGLRVYLSGMSWPLKSL